MFDCPFQRSAEFRMFSVGSMDYFSLHDCLFSKCVTGNQPFSLPFHSYWDHCRRFFSAEEKEISSNDALARVPEGVMTGRLTLPW
jgi:hypothetical protein